MGNEKCSVKIRDNKIDYTVVKTKRKTIGITIDMNGEVKVSAPLHISEKQIEETIQKKANWIIKKLDEVRKMNLKVVYKEFVRGEKFLYLGKEYTLEIVEEDLSKVEIYMQDDTISVHIARELPEEIRKQVIKEILIEWYRQRFAEIVKERIEKYSTQLKVVPCKVVIKDQKTRWGSCSSKGNININWRLVMVPIDIIDYVVVHELCHLKIMNHSRDFWNLVESIVPDYRGKREWLKVNGFLTHII
jgi:predicted metal-dependent hydrolase